MTIRIAPNLTLPIEAVTETFAILAKRGKGKTNCAVVMTEEMIKAGQQVVVVDPVGVWWGLSSSGDGQGEGLPVVIFGGDHGHVPLEETAGELIADVVIDNQTSVVIDLSLLRKGASRRFMTDFIERLYHRNREPLHVIVDEADAFAPQRAQADGARLLGAMEDLVRRGRARGIGCTLITQRPAVINKDVLTQAEVLICLGMTGVQDINAIDAWVKQHAEEGEAATVKASLPSLPVGTAWVWSPGWLGQLKQVKIRKRRTFDSSATPKPGQRRVVPKKFAQVDLDALGEQIRATVEKRKAEDPRELKKRIRALEAEVNRLRDEVQQEQRRTAAAERVVETISELPPQQVISPEILSTLERQIPVLGDLLSSTQELLRSVHGGLARVANTDTRQKASPAPPPRSAPAPKPASSSPASSRTPAQPRKTEARSDFAPERQLPPAKRKLLETLVSLESIGVNAAPRNQVALFAGVSPKSSGYQNNLGAMNTAGLIHYPGPGRVAITEAGRAYVGEVPPPATTQDLHERVRTILPPGRWRIIEALIEAYPDPVARDELADRAGVSASSSGYQNNLGALRTFGLLDYPERGWVAAADILFVA